ncbi:MAG: SEC-C domain-containing protein, partial [Clostridia bacterium]|nr:SEC-C domain-containing protein [Clostridia bacterium]
VLVGTVSIDKSEELSALLRREGIAHSVLNAKHHEKEAEIVAQAGKFGAVTISTNMAGRGTDIMLGGNPEYMAKQEMRRLEFEEELIAMATGTAEINNEEVKEARRVFRELYEKYKKEIEPEAEKVREAGGLFILGTERHESRRIDNQLRGRSGRQGDPGESRFFLSLEDDLMRLFGSERMLGMVQNKETFEDLPIDVKLISGLIENSQKRIEEMNFKRRMNVITYDDVMNQQRNIIYKQRQSVLDGEDVGETIRKMISSTIEENVASFIGGESAAEWNFDGLRNHYRGLLCSDDDFRYSEDELKKLDKDDISSLLTERAMKIYNDKKENVGEELFKEIERSVLLRNVDLKWMEHIDAMDDLKETIGLQAYAQRDPVREYRIAGGDMFDEMIAEIRENTVRTILSFRLADDSAIKRVAVAKPKAAGFAGGDAPKKGMKKVGSTIIRKDEKVGRNDPCPCGSGKKYKKCCGANNGGADED